MIFFDTSIVIAYPLKRRMRYTSPPLPWSSCPWSPQIANLRATPKRWASRWNY